MKAISYCLYGTELKYYIGAERNVTINKQLLPDWSSVIYYNSFQILDGWYERLVDSGANMVDVNGISLTSSITYPMFWRYLAFLENYQALLIRDLDSRVSLREVEYIQRWLESDRNIFIIRDHPWHAPTPGGLFGVRDSSVNLREYFTNFVQSRPHGWGTDQEMLTEYVQAGNTESVFYCGFDRADTYIPRDNLDFFIGMQIDENEQPAGSNALLSLQYLKDLRL